LWRGTLVSVAAPIALVVLLPEHPDEHRPQSSIFLTVDQQLGEGAFSG
jgi:hypothetical protein